MTIRATEHIMMTETQLKGSVAVGAGAFVGAQFGAKIAKKIRPSWIVVLLAFIMVCLGAQLFLRGYLA